VPKASKALHNNSAVKQEPSQRQRVDDILRRRERLIAETQMLGAVEGCAESAKKAQQLLTRWWAKADWNAREELLRATEWVLRIEATGRPEPAPR
jgi:hypothetical protein